jgi:hypothetical protein
LHEPHFQQEIAKVSFGVFDDLLIYHMTWEDHLRKLDEVLSIMGEKSLYSKALKCDFGKMKILFLGHVINA